MTDSDDQLQLRVMWDWHAFPVWGHVDVDGLPISDPLRRRLQEWSDARTSAGGSIPDGWDQEGRRLAAQLRNELPEAIVAYHDGRTGQDGSQ